MDRKTHGLLLSELHSAQAYMERLFHALIDMSSLQGLEECQIISAQGEFQLSELLETQILRPEFTLKDPQPSSLRSLRRYVQHTGALLRSLVELQGTSQKVIETCVDFINAFYELAHELHQIADTHTELEVQWPRLNLIEMVPRKKEFQVLSREESSDESHEESDSQEKTQNDPPRRFGKAQLYAIQGGLKDQKQNQEQDQIETQEQNPNEEQDKTQIPFFKLPLETVLSLCQEKNIDVDHLEWQREKKYEELIASGHDAIIERDYSRALESFSRARNYRETAEILTLMGWTHSLLAQNEKAKSYCLKAIQKDPDYGPPYNDLGSYLLSEGQVEESLKWFELAKKAPHYQNREYPYINAGRAYMTKRNIPKALEEFSKALTLAPYHDELHQTVEKLKKSMKPSTDDTSLN